MLKRCLWLGRRGILRRRDRFTLRLNEVDARLRKVGMFASFLLVLPVMILFAVFLMLSYPMVWAYHKVVVDFLGIYRPTLSTFEPWEWEMVKVSEAERLGKQGLTQAEERDLEERVKHEMWEAWDRRRRGLSRADTPLLDEMLGHRNS